MRLPTVVSTLVALLLVACVSVHDEATKKVVAEARMRTVQAEVEIARFEASGNESRADRQRRSASRGMTAKCSQLIARGDLVGARAYLDVFDDAGLALDDDVDAVREKIAAKIEALEREETRGASLQVYAFDDENALAYLGFAASKRLFVEDDVMLYVGAGTTPPGSDRTAETHFVAVHDVDADADVLELEHAIHDEEGRLERIRYSDDVHRFYAGLCDRLKRAAPGPLVEINGYEQLAIDHYTKGALSNTIAASEARVDRVLPLMRTSFFRAVDEADGSWQPNYERMTDGVFTVGTTHDGANSLAQAVALRSSKDAELTETRRWNALSPGERRKEILAKQADAAEAERSRVLAEERAHRARVRAEELARYEAEDPLLRGPAREQGLIYRDWSYWADLEFGAELRGVLNGTTVQVGADGVFPLIHQEFVVQFFLECPELLHGDVIKIELQTIYEIDYGGFTADTPGRVRTFRLKRRLYDSYRYYSDNITLMKATGFLEQFAELRDFDETRRKTEFVLAVKEDIRTLYAREACDSGFMQQFEENLYRIAHGLHPLQAEDVVHPYLALDR